jgi:predicted acetyltransferase
MPAVRLEPLQRAQAPILSNLVELYCHDLSDVFALRIGQDGRYHYPQLARFWEQPAGHFAFLLYSDDQLAGFALATRGSPATDDPSHLDVAEFFVLRSARQRGVGARAAHLLWDRFDGHWVVRVAAKNAGAVSFWRRAVDAYAAGQHRERTVELGGVVRHVFELDARPGS